MRRRRRLRLVSPLRPRCVHQLMKPLDDHPFLRVERTSDVTGRIGHVVRLDRLRPVTHIDGCAAADPLPLPLPGHRVEHGGWNGVIVGIGRPGTYIVRFTGWPGIDNASASAPHATDSLRTNRHAGLPPRIPLRCKPACADGEFRRARYLRAGRGCCRPWWRVSAHRTGCSTRGCRS